MIIDCKLTWKNHISSVYKKIIGAAALIAKLRHYTNKNTLKLIYYALVYPYLTCGNLLWGNTYHSKLQKKIVTLISFKSYLEHSNLLFWTLKLLDIFKINDYLCSLFKYFKNLPEFYFTQNNEIYHNTRSSNKLHVRYSRTNYTKHTLPKKGVTTWNVLLDNNISNILSYSTFKRKTNILPKI